MGAIQRKQGHMPARHGSMVGREYVHVFWKLVENATSHPITFTENWHYAPTNTYCYSMGETHVCVCVCVCVCVYVCVHERQRLGERERVMLMKVREQYQSQCPG